MKQICKVYHVEFNAPVEVDGELKKDFYFGSKAAIYGTLSPEQIGITYNYLRSNVHLDKQEYSNSKCTIRKGLLSRKKKG
jgi:hypothetical protein|nr:MAG TPA: hypothetical protein [Caudoviricetes sp.]